MEIKNIAIDIIDGWNVGLCSEFLESKKKFNLFTEK